MKTNIPAEDNTFALLKAAQELYELSDEAIHQLLQSMDGASIEVFVQDRQWNGGIPRLSEFCVYGSREEAVLTARKMVHAEPSMPRDSWRHAEHIRYSKDQETVEESVYDLVFAAEVAA